MGNYLAIDAGVKTGFALFSDQGTLLKFSSHNYGSMGCLKRDMKRFFILCDPLDAIIIEGGGNIAQAWRKEAECRNIDVIAFHAETWRREMFKISDPTKTKAVKELAIQTARKIIADAGLPLPKTLMADAAEAILAGYWAIKKRNLEAAE